MLSPIRYFLGLAALIGYLMPALAVGDPPGRVGRLSQADGNVIFRADRQDPGSPATINWPISSGAIIDTERRSRAEVWIGSTAYRLAANSRAEFVTVNDQIVDLLLASGTVTVSIRDRDQADDLQISTPGGDVRFPGPGRFRIEVQPDRTTVAAQSGNAEISAGERTISVRPGEMATLDRRGGVGIDAAPYGDDFDAWVSAQDNRERSNAARRHVSSHMTGYQDLDAYGDWSSAPDYGTVWYPRTVTADWAPYRDGRWAWIDPWGWTWIDAAPWGFAPFHYGRWVQVGGRWGWAPGTYAARPVYAPALVAWIGDPGRNVRSSHASPAVGWFPLAPREVYVPGYRTSPTYVRRINTAHVHDHAHIDRALRPEYRPNYAYQGHPQAVTVVPANTLRDGKPIGRENMRPHDPSRYGQTPAKTAAPGNDWRPPPGGAAPLPQPGQAERHPQRADNRPPSEFPQQVAPAAPQAGQRDRRDMPPPSGRPPESRGRQLEPEAPRSVPEIRRNMDNPGRFPAPEEQRVLREERNRQAPPANHPMPPAAPVQHEQRRDVYREPQQYRAPPQHRQPAPESMAPMPRAMPQQQQQPQVPPQRQPQASPPPMREMQRMEQRPPPQPDHGRRNHSPDDRGPR